MLNRQELSVLKMIVAGMAGNKETHCGVNLQELYGKLNVMWAESRKEKKDDEQRKAVG